MNNVLIFLIKIYQKLFSPILPKSCRFYPSCSQYSIEAFEIHGFFMASFLTLKRIIKCNPFCECGYDPVPAKKKYIQILKPVNKF